MEEPSATNQAGTSPPRTTSTTFLEEQIDSMLRTLLPQFGTCLGIATALTVSSFISIASPSNVFAEATSVQEALEQEALEKVAVAFAMMGWLPRLEAACELHKKGFFAESELPEAYRILYQSYGSLNSNPEAAKTFSKLMELLEAGPQAMADYFGEDNADAFDVKYFDGCPLPNKALGF